MFYLTAKFQKKVMNGFQQKALRTDEWTDGRTDEQTNGQGLNSSFFRILLTTNPANL